MSSPAPVVPPRPEPVLKAARQTSAVVALIAALGTALGAYGVTTGQQWAEAAAAIVGAITTALGATMPKITASGARAQVTPLESPVGVDGTTPLVPADFTHAVSPSMEG